MISAPFRWAGSKAKVTSELYNHFKENNVYVEAFLGSGVVLFRLLELKRYKRYIVNDINVSVIEFYKAVKNDVNKVIHELEAIKKDYLASADKEAYYYQTRKEFNQNKRDYVRFWLLMKCGFNGLYRENSKGQYNVPFGKKDKITLDVEQLHIISKLIQDVEFYALDYQEFYKMLKLESDTMSYNDPPYCSSQQYTASKFNNNNLADFLIDKGFDVAISDIDTLESNSTYKSFNKRLIKEVKRVINIRNVESKQEVIYTNY
jgi:DNA adenine methylase